MSWLKSTSQENNTANQKEGTLRLPVTGSRLQHGKQMVGGSTTATTKIPTIKTGIPMLGGGKLKTKMQRPVSLNETGGMQAKTRGVEVTTLNMRHTQKHGRKKQPNPRLSSSLQLGKHLCAGSGLRRGSRERSLAVKDC